MNKFWPKNSPGFHLFPHQVITTRERGEIPGCVMLPPNERYSGVFPTKETCEFINSVKSKMKFFDDGVRMRYNAPDYRVPVEPSKVEHPITYAPAGFQLVDEHWVLKEIV